MTPNPPRRKPDVLDRILAGLEGSLLQSSHPMISKAMVRAIAFLGVITALLVASPLLFINDTVYDIFIPLDGAWRMANGQWPHRDFVTPVGAAYYILLGVAGWLMDQSPRLVIIANSLLLPFVIAASILLSAGRLPGSLRAVIVVFVGMITISPRTLDETGLINFLASYNRHSWALTIVVLLGVLVPPIDTGRRAWKAEALVLALLTILLFHIKLTFFVVAAGSLAIGALVVPGNRTVAATALALVAAVLGVSTLTSDFNSLYLADVMNSVRSTPLEVGHHGPYRLFKLQADLTANWFDLLVPLVLAFWLSRTARTAGERLEAALAMLAMIVATAGSIALAYQNHDHSAPTQIAAAAILAGAIWRRYHARRQSAQPEPVTASMIAAFLMIIMVSASITFDTLASVRHALTTTLGAGQVVAPDHPRLRDLMVPAGLSKSRHAQDVLDGRLASGQYLAQSFKDWASDIPVILTDGENLFNRYRPENPRVATLFFAPIMAWQAGVTPARGVLAWWDWGRTFGPHAPMNPAVRLADANTVMVLSVMLEHHLGEEARDYLRTEFTLVGETALWQMWIRNGTQNGATQ